MTMEKRRELSVKEYITELMDKGKLTDKPIIKSNNKNLQPTYITEDNDKYFIAKQSLHSLDSLIYFPTNTEHAEIFSKSQVRCQGPQDKAPGSIAILGMEKYMHELTIDYIQYSFIQGSPKELTRSIASQYMGARNRLIEHLLNQDWFPEIEIIKIWGLKENKSNLKTFDKLIKKKFGKKFRLTTNYFGNQIYKKT